MKSFLTAPRLLQDTDGNQVRADQIVGLLHQGHHLLVLCQHQHQTRQPKYQTGRQLCQLHHRLTNSNSTQSHHHRIQLKLLRNFDALLRNL